MNGTDIVDKILDGILEKREKRIKAYAAVLSPEAYSILRHHVYDQYQYTVDAWSEDMNQRQALGLRIVVDPTKKGIYVTIY